MKRAQQNTHRARLVSPFSFDELARARRSADKAIYFRGEEKLAVQNPPPNQQDYGYDNPYSTPPPNAPLVTPPGRGPGGKSSTGLDANIAALLSYLLTWITGLIFFLIEKENRFVRFHAMQAILFGAAIFIISIVLSVTLGIVSYISWILGSLFSLAWLLFWLAFLVGWILCMIKAYQGQMFKLPIIGDMAEKIVNK